MKKRYFSGYNTVEAGLLIQAKAIGAMFNVYLRRFSIEFQLAFMALTILSLIGLALVRSLGLPAEAGLLFRNGGIIFRFHNTLNVDLLF